MRFITAWSVVELFRRETVTPNLLVGTDYIKFDFHGFGNIWLKISASLTLQIFLKGLEIPGICAEPIFYSAGN
jgi:hypothetical protein